MILVTDDLSPKFDALTEKYLQKGEDRYQELAEDMQVPAGNLRAIPSAKVKRYLAVFVSKAYCRDRIGTNLSQSIDGQTTDPWLIQFEIYDSEEEKLLNGLNDWDMLSDINRSSTVNTGRSTRSVSIRRG